MSQAGPLDPTHLSLGIGLQPEQTAHLQGLRLDDASPHKVFRVGVHVVQESRAKPQKLRRKRGARPVSSQTVARQFPKAISQKGEGEVPTSRSRSKAGWDASLLFLTLALVTSGSMGWLALKIFCASCWGLRQERGESGPRPRSSGLPTLDQLWLRPQQLLTGSAASSAGRSPGLPSPSAGRTC